MTSDIPRAIDLTEITFKKKRNNTNMLGGRATQAIFLAFTWWEV